MLSLHTFVFCFLSFVSFFLLFPGWAVGVLLGVVGEGVGGEEGGWGIWGVRVCSLSEVLLEEEKRVVISLQKICCFFFFVLSLHQLFLFFGGEKRLAPFLLSVVSLGLFVQTIVYQELLCSASPLFPLPLSHTFIWCLSLLSYNSLFTLPSLPLFGHLFPLFPLFPLSLSVFLGGGGFFVALGWFLYVFFTLRQVYSSSPTSPSSPPPDDNHLSTFLLTSSLLGSFIAVLPPTLPPHSIWMLGVHVVLLVVDVVMVAAVCLFVGFSPLFLGESIFSPSSRSSPSLSSPPSNAIFWAVESPLFSLLFQPLSSLLCLTHNLVEQVTNPDHKISRSQQTQHSQEKEFIWRSWRCVEGLFHTIEDMSMFTYEFLGGVGVGVGGVSIEGGVGDGFCGGQFGKGSKESLSLSPTISLPSSSSESSFFFAEVFDDLMESLIPHAAQKRAFLITDIAPEVLTMVMRGNKTVYKYILQAYLSIYIQKVEEKQLLSHSISPISFSIFHYSLSSPPSSFPSPPSIDLWGKKGGKGRGSGDGKIFLEVEVEIGETDLPFSDSEMTGEITEGLGIRLPLSHHFLTKLGGSLRSTPYSLSLSLPFFYKTHFPLYSTLSSPLPPLSSLPPVPTSSSLPSSPSLSPIFLSSIFPPLSLSLSRHLSSAGFQNITEIPPKFLGGWGGEEGALFVDVEILHHFLTHSVSFCELLGGRVGRVVALVWKYDGRGKWYFGEVERLLGGRGVVVDVLWLPFLMKELFGVVNRILSFYSSPPSPIFSQQLKGNVLLVEDNKSSVKVCVTLLKRISPRVTCDVAFNGVEALNLLKKGKKYDLILMDLHMPLLNGFETAKKIRQLESNHQIGSKNYIVALTVSSFLVVRKQCSGTGMDFFLSKPVKMEEMKEALFTRPRGWE